MTEREKLSLVCYKERKKNIKVITNCCRKEKNSCASIESIKRTFAHENRSFFFMNENLFDQKHDLKYICHINI
jgi:hypothetical protein